MHLYCVKITQKILNKKKKTISLFIFFPFSTAEYYNQENGLNNKTDCF